MHHATTHITLTEPEWDRASSAAGDPREFLHACTDGPRAAVAPVLSFTRTYQTPHHPTYRMLTTFKFLIASDGSIAGYFPPDQPDLVVVSSMTLGPLDNIEFQNAFRSILATANAAGKTKLIMDIRGNGGGTVADGFDWFTQLFPGQIPWGATNLAAFGLTNALGEVATSLVAGGNVSGQALGALKDFDVMADLNIVLTQYDS